MSVHLRRSGALTEIVLARPPVNAFDADQIERLGDAVNQVRADEDTRCLVIKADGVFSAGADIGMMASLLPEPERFVAVIALMQKVYADIEELPIPTIAVIDRAATGGGLELALACDFRIVSANAKLGLPEVRIGLIPGAGGTQRLTRLVGAATAKRLILTGQLIDGATAVALGVAHSAVDATELDATVAALTATLIDASAAAIAEAKRLIAASGTPTGFSEELRAVHTLVQSTDTASRLHAFLTKASTARNGGDQPPDRNPARSKNRPGGSQ